MTCEDDAVVWIVAPQFDEVNDVAESQTRMAAKHDTWL